VVPPLLPGVGAHPPAPFSWEGVAPGSPGGVPPAGDRAPPRGVDV